MILAWAIAATLAALTAARRVTIVRRTNRALHELLTNTEAERRRIQREYLQYRAGAARRRGPGVADRPVLSLLPGDPDSKRLGGAS